MPVNLPARVARLGKIGTATIYFLSEIIIFALQLTSAGGEVVFERGVRKFLRLGLPANGGERKNLRRVRLAAGASRTSLRKHNLDRPRALVHRSTTTAAPWPQEHF